ncbi:amiloride-sensitive amine oxidase [copper-containing] [Leucoraja erinacea]|uniref:amiloride-sensitive amine oxidase [copper-containing] n=1 Tax=Leucoraja erinaceus TaxID=7782 RepID=UPI00245564C9|nr:amiloride-sensitive amine oxidase [copper-containing] [Leucoraja erinacea]XP_055489520.1 amiloride-sensitive amine oxidase [copper-containing] [Leucoraja erinacea]
MFSGAAALLLALALVEVEVALASGDTERPQDAERWQRQAALFADLSVSELLSVTAFLHSQPELRLSPAAAPTLRKNHIYLVELQPPRKRDALRFFHSHLCPPRRRARVLLSFGAESPPNVTEYVVGPLPKPRYYYPLHTVRFSALPATTLEYKLMLQRLSELTSAATPLLQRIAGATFNNCSSRCLTFTDAAPRGRSSGERRSWLIIQRDVEGFYLHPTGLEILLDHRGVEPARWALEKLWYNGHYFDSVEQLVASAGRGEVPIVPLPEHGPDLLFSSYTPRGRPHLPLDRPGPRLWQPAARRYWVRGNAVMYAGWSFAYRVASGAGLQLWDVRFAGEPVAHEVSVQEAAALYGGHSPATAQTKYLDRGWVMGAMGYELAPGIDCPHTASFHHLFHQLDSDRPVRHRNALCIFEQPSGVPLRRHYSSDLAGGYTFYGGLEGQVLVLRTTSTVFNYDYIWDFLFHPNGVLEGKIHASGYLHSSFYTPAGLRYGSRIQQHLLGNLHTHLVHYRVDMDVAGTGNSFETLDMRLENISHPWVPGERLVQPRLERVPRPRERSATFTFHKSLPRYLLVYSPGQQNKWGHHRAYRIQLLSQAGLALPRDGREEEGLTWARYPVAVTRFRENESSSSSIFLQNDIWEPDVRFQDFLCNNENITDQDLVVWVTVGFLHIPHAEDVPNTSTPGNAAGFMLRPFNFFDRDPSAGSPDVVILRPESSAAAGVRVEARPLPISPQCPLLAPFSYNGSYLPV